MSTGNKPEAEKHKTIIFYITDNGRALAERLEQRYPRSAVEKFNAARVAEVWKSAGTLIFIMAAGIVVRTVALLVKDKRTDPAVLVLDDKGKFCISLLCGHLGGANDRAKEIAGFLSGEAVVTTASDVNDMPAIDLWAAENDLAIEEWTLLPALGTRLINNCGLSVYAEAGLRLPGAFSRVVDPRFADIIITNKAAVYRSAPSLSSDPPVASESLFTEPSCAAGFCHVKEQLYLRPRNLILGIGCNSGTPEAEIGDAVRRALEAYNLSPLSLRAVATIDLKAGEPGLVEFARKSGLEMITYTAGELNAVPGVVKSDTVHKATGAYAVAAPAALLAAGAEALAIPKQKTGNVTVAVAEIRKPGSAETAESKENLEGEFRAHGKICIVGTGPGGAEHITPYAQKIIREADVIVGYGTYIDLIPGLVAGKEVFSTGMTREVDRCRKAIELAERGKSVAVISGGDPGIYAMAGLVFELLKSRQPSDISHRLSVEVVPGISALNACAARLGAPLMHDFAAISLSDRLTPWEVIEKRLTAAASADFVIALYNPKSMGRPEHITTARAICLKYRSTETPVGIVKGAMRENERIVITTLRDMLNHDIDMQTTVIIGNSRTFTWDKWMITPRGYGDKGKF
ncbi:MAG: precorrin-3B C(17)-methyltransferase [Nitrospirota bacterium]